VAKLLALLGLCLLAGCTLGYSVKPLAVSPSGLTLQYSGFNHDEMVYAYRTAQAHCAYYGKDAQPVGAPFDALGGQVAQAFRCVKA
jgi:hypothetical protein